jgi:hypothetical protein
MVLDHGKRDGGKGVVMESMAAKPFEQDYVEPQERSNPEYLRKLKLEAHANEKAKREKALKAFGLGFSGGVIGASPNSPSNKVQLIY